MSGQEDVLKTIESVPLTNISTDMVKYIGETTDTVLLQLYGNSVRVGELLRAALRQAFVTNDHALAFQTLQALARIPFHKLVLAKNELGKAVNKAKKTAAANNDSLLRDLAEHIIELWKSLHNTGAASTSNNRSGSGAKVSSASDNQLVSTSTATTHIRRAVESNVDAVNKDTLTQAIRNTIPNNASKNTADMLTNSTLRNDPVLAISNDPPTSSNTTNTAAKMMDNPTRTPLLAISKDPSSMPKRSNNSSDYRSIATRGNQPQHAFNQHISQMDRMQNTTMNSANTVDEQPWTTSNNVLQGKRLRDEALPHTLKRVRFSEELTDVRLFDRHPSEWGDLMDTDGDSIMASETEQSVSWRKPPKLKLSIPQPVRKPVDSNESIARRKSEASAVRVPYMNGSDFLPMTPSEPEIDDSLHVINANVPIIPSEPLEEHVVSASSSASRTTTAATTVSAAVTTAFDGKGKSAKPNKIESILDGHPELVALFNQLTEQAENRKKQIDIDTVRFVKQQAAASNIDVEQSTSSGSRPRHTMSVCRYYKSERGCRRNPCPFRHVN